MLFYEGLLGPCLQLLGVGVGLLHAATCGSWHKSDDIVHILV